MELKKTKADLEEELKDQIYFLRESARIFDEGNIREAKRLATYLYILLHDGSGRTKSLLRQLGIRGSLSFVSTALKTAPNGEMNGVWVGVAPPLTCVQMSADGTKFLPHCIAQSGAMPSWSRVLPFGKWWDEAVSSEGRRPLSRKGLIWTVRSQDGGAHVDGSLKSESYVELITDPLPIKPEFAVSFEENNGTALSPANPHWASVRQIAWEVDNTLKDYGL